MSGGLKKFPELALCNFFRVALFTLMDSTVLLKPRFMTALLKATPPPM
jgi:hypothetical protein